MAVVIARLVKHKTDDGLVEVKDEIPIGRLYKVETNSRRQQGLLNIDEGLHHVKELIETVPFEGWLCMELLELGRAPGEVQPWDDADTPVEDEKADY